MTPRAPSRGRRKVTLVLVATITVAVAGYLTGTARGPQRSGYAHVDAESATGASTRAPRQADMAAARYASRNAELVAAFALLGDAPRTAEDALVLTPAERAASLATHAERRAYEGAPPTVPHAVDQRGMPACVVCHERGMRVNGRVASAMPHPVFASCLQCHAPTRGVPTRTPRPPSVSTESTFVGLPAPGAAR